MTGFTYMPSQVDGCGYYFTKGGTWTYSRRHQSWQHAPPYETNWRDVDETAVPPDILLAERLETAK